MQPFASILGFFLQATSIISSLCLDSRQIIECASNLALHGGEDDNSSGRFTRSRTRRFCLRIEINRFAY
jgi:hypothetical protein